MIDLTPTELEALIQQMRDQGMSPIDSIRVLRTQHGFALIAAKGAIQESKAWSSQRDIFPGTREWFERERELDPELWEGINDPSE